MDTQELSYTLETDRSVSETLQRIEKISPERQFRVLAVHDVQETLHEKGFERGPLRIVEVCNAGFAHEALKKSIDVSLFMPCKIVLYEEHGKTQVMLGRPTMISQVLPDKGLEKLASEIEDRLISLMKEVVKE